MILSQGILPHLNIDIPEFFVDSNKRTKEFKWAFDPVLSKKITAKQRNLVLWKQIAIRTSLAVSGIIPISIVLDIGYNLLRWSFGYLIIRYHNRKVKKLSFLDRLDKTKVSIAALASLAIIKVISGNIQKHPLESLQRQQLPQIDPILAKRSLMIISSANILKSAALFSLGALSLFVRASRSRISLGSSSLPPGLYEHVEENQQLIPYQPQDIARRDYNNRFSITDMIMQLQDVRRRLLSIYRMGCLHPSVMPELEVLQGNLLRLANPGEGIRINPNAPLAILEIGQNREKITLHNLPLFLDELQFRLSVQLTRNIFTRNGYRPQLMPELQPMQLAIEAPPQLSSLESVTVDINRGMSLGEFINLTTFKSQPFFNKIGAAVHYFSCCCFGNGKVPLDVEAHSSLQELYLARESLIITDSAKLDDEWEMVSTEEKHRSAIMRRVGCNEVNLLKLIEHLRRNQQLSQDQITYLLPKVVDGRDDVIIDNSLLFADTINIGAVRKKIHDNTKYILLPIGIKGRVENHVVLAIIDLENQHLEYVDRKGIAPGNRKNHHFMVGDGTIPSVLFDLCRKFDLNKLSYATSERQRDHFNCAPLMLDRAFRIDENLDAYLSRPIDTKAIRLELIKLIQKDIRTYKPSEEDLRPQAEGEDDFAFSDDDE